MAALLSWFQAGLELVTMGAWDGDRLVVQYNARLQDLSVLGLHGPVHAGMDLNWPSIPRIAAGASSTRS